MKALFIAACALVLASCATVPDQGGDGAADPGSFVLADLQAAQAMAEAGGDTLAAMCWTKLIELKKAAPETDGADVVGALSAYQRIRNVRRTARVGISDGVKVACAPMLMDSRLVLLRFGLIVARRALP